MLMMDAVLPGAETPISPPSPASLEKKTASKKRVQKGHATPPSELLPGPSHSQLHTALHAAADRALLVAQHAREAESLNIHHCRPAKPLKARIHLDGGIEEITLQGRGKKLQSEASSLKARAAGTWAPHFPKLNWALVAQLDRCGARSGGLVQAKDGLEHIAAQDELEDLAMRRPARRLMNKDKQGKATSALRTNDTANAPAGGSAAEVGGFPWERRNVDALANAAALIDSQLRKEGAPASGEKGGNPRSQAPKNPPPLAKRVGQQKAKQDASFPFVNPPVARKKKTDAAPSKEKFTRQMRDGPNFLIGM
ncbi:hypothetical protein CYMTET_7330 [Cymbomonas tetramitiformis]|uniref:Uncharacterized protein n=1 Tax=Cymbomonas tetramitiformis TaxID=36881 RepID=A0AAE0LH65_9CHLO|nr:hypothetical protein CYMTET_7330 [Cymbomonas tetramitiformis]